MSSDAMSLPEIVSLDGVWDFSYQPEAPGGEPVAPEADGFAARMPVPGYWDDHLDGIKESAGWSAARFNPRVRPAGFPLGVRPPDAALPFLLGVGWYRRRVVAPAAWQDRQVALVVGGVVLEAWVFLDGRLLKHHLGHSTPFEVMLPLKPGASHELVLAVANTRTDRSGTVIRGYSGFSAGIRRSVFLKVSGARRIADLWLTPSTDLGELTWRAEVEGAGQGEIRWAARDAAGALLGQGQTPAPAGRVTWTTSSLGMKPWSDHEANLYEVEAALWSGGRRVDRVTQSFGLRRLTAHGMGLRLNGRPVILRGATEHAYFPLTCTPPPDVESYREFIRRQREIGFNWLRFHTWVPSEEYMRAADELGMMIQVEAPVGSEEAEWVDIFKTCRRHASVVIYCGGNEQLLDEARIERLRRMAALAREHAPDALFSPQEALRGVEYGWAAADVGAEAELAAEPFKHNPRRLAALKEFSDVFGQYAWGHHSYLSVDCDTAYVDKCLAIYERPCLSHENGIHGNYLNLDLARRYEGTRIGTSLFDSAREALRRAGLLDKAALYYRNSCAWMAAVRKHNLESTRLARRVAGYDFLGGIDCHWHRTGYPCGVLNEFYELKPGETARDVLRYNGESLLLLGHGCRWNYAAGAEFGAELFASLYGERPLACGELALTLRDETGRALWRERRAVKEAPNGQNASLGFVRFKAPALGRPARLVLEARLSGGEYEVENQWELWVFPEAPETRGEAARFVTKLDAATARFIADGGRAVLLGAGPFEALPTSFQLSCAGRAEGNLATVISDHPLLRGFPHDGYCDWQFHPMLHGAKAVSFQAMDDLFDPIVEVVSSFKTIRKQAAVFELAVGKGALLVCSFNLPDDDPGARFFKARLAAYAAGEAFHPRKRISLERLEALAGAGSGSVAQFETDQALDPNAQMKKK